MENTQVSNNVVNNIRELICNTPIDANIAINDEQFSLIGDITELINSLLCFASIAFTVEITGNKVDCIITGIDRAGNITLENQLSGAILILNKYGEEVHSEFNYTKLRLVICSIPEH